MAEYKPLHHDYDVDDEEQHRHHHSQHHQHHSQHSQQQLFHPHPHHHYSTTPLPMSVITKPKSSRIASLDVFRGLSVFLMTLVDYGGSVIAAIAHTPWHGLQLADLVMPFFLFVAGISLAIVYKKVEDKMDATKKATGRAAKLFLLGIFLQGGFFHGAKSLTYGVDLLTIRWMGILQRIAIAYLVAALCEIWLPCHKCRKFSIIRSYLWQWCLACFLCTTYLGLLYGLYVPDWQFQVSNSASSFSSNSSSAFMVKCGLRGDLGPACNSAGMIDRYILGTNHLYAKPSFGNLKVCHKLKNGHIPQDSPSWCHAPYDPEGILGSLTAAVTCIIGLQFGHILVHIQDHKERLLRWSMLSFITCFLGVVLALLGLPLNKSLYTVSYLLVTSAAAGFTFCALYLLVDLWGYRWCMSVLEWMGVHALTIFILLTSNLAIILVQGFYWGSPENNFIHWVISCFIHQ